MATITSSSSTGSGLFSNIQNAILEKRNHDILTDAQKLGINSNEIDQNLISRQISSKRLAMETLATALVLPVAGVLLMGVRAGIESDREKKKKRIEQTILNKTPDIRHLFLLKENNILRRPVRKTL